MSNDFYKDLSDLCKVDPQAVTIAGLNTNLIEAKMMKGRGEVTIGVDAGTIMKLVTDSDFYIGGLLLVDRKKFNTHIVQK
jgi:hypothetical protein